MDTIEVKLIPIDGKNSDTVKPYNLATKEYIPEGVAMIKAPEVWKSNITGKGITVAVIDTGCATQHIDLKDQIIGGRNFTTDDNGNPNIFEDYNGHGTHVCGTIAARGNGVGLIGVAPGAKLLILKVLDKKGFGTSKGLIDAIKYAVEQKVDIISMSLGTSANIQALYDVIKLAVQKEIVVVCAAGNEGDNNSETDELVYPGAYNEVINVGAVINKKNAAMFTNSNKEVDLVAPGVNVVSTFLNNGYRSLSGTSMATPHVAGALALIKEWGKIEFMRNLTETELYAQLIKNTIDLSMKRRVQGSGILELNLKFQK